MRMLLERSPESVLAVTRRLVPQVPKAAARKVIRIALLRPAQVEILRVLLGGPATAREVAEELGWEPARTTRDLRLLEAEGFVRRYEGDQPYRAFIWEIVE